MEQKFKAASWIAGAGVMALGLMVLLGWVLDLPALTHGLLASQPMTFNSAASFVIAAACLAAWRLLPPGRAPLAPIIGGAGILTIGSLTLSQYALGWTLGLDLLLHPQSSWPSQELAQGRMAPLSAIGFVLLGLSLLIFARRSTTGAAELLALAAGCLGLAGILGHLYGIEGLHRLGPSMSMAPHTGLAFCFIAAAIVLARPDRGVIAMISADTLTGTIARRVIPLALVLPAVLGLVRVLGQRDGWFETAGGTAMLVTAYSALFAGLMLSILWRLSSVEREAAATRSALAESERRLRVALDALPLPVFISDAAGRLFQLNPAAESQWGGPPPRSSGMHQYAEHYPAWWTSTGRKVEAHEWGLARALATGEIVEAEEMLVLTLDGRHRTILNYARPIRDADGAITGGVAVNVDITQRKIAEAELQQARADAERRAAEAEQGRRTLQALMDNIPEGIVITGGPPDFPIRSVSRRGIAMSGQDPAERLMGHPSGQHQAAWGLRLADGVTLPTPEQMPLYRATRLGEEIKNQEMVMVRADGSRLSIIVDAAPIRDGEGRIVAGINCWRDITDLKGAERDRRQSQQRLALAIEGGGLGAWDLDIVTGAAWRSLKHDQIFGYPTLLGEWTYQMFLNHVVPEDREAVAVAFRQAVDGRRDWSFECRIRTAGGAVRWIWVQSKHLLGPAGEPHRMFGIVRDITEHKLAVESLRREQDFLRQVIDASPSMIFVKDWEGRFVLANETLATLYGTTIAGLVGKTDADFNANADEVASFLRDDREVMSTHRPKLIAEEPVTGADGRLRWFSTSKIPMVSSDGSCDKVLGVATDISDRKLAEQTLASFNERLAREVEQKTRELLESGERLRRSERMAFIGTLSAGLGHDIGNLLLPIRTRLESIAVDPALPEETRTDLVVTQRGLDYLTRLTSGLRTLAIDPEHAGRTDESTDLAQWWHEAGPLLRGVLPRGTTLEWRPPPPGLGVRLGVPALTQIVFNLVQNAGDALKGREAGRVLIWSEPDDKTDQVRLAVGDDGPGMSEEVRRRCMDPFFTTKTRQVSTGMGLSLVLGLVQRAGGSIEVDSRPGHGATFVLTLPLSRPAVKPAGRPLATVSVGDARMAAFVESMLGSMGFDVQRGDAPGGKTACLWVLTDAEARDRDIAAFLEGGSRRRVVILGEDADGQESPRVIVVRRADGPPAIRRALRAAGAACSTSGAPGVAAGAP